MLAGFVFHYIDTHGLFSKYKLHTSAEDLTKNRASRMDVIKFALIQQAAQCTLGYLMADDTEQFISSNYATALWAQRIRYAELIVVRWIPCPNYFWPSTASEFKSTKSTSPSALSQNSLGDLLETSPQAFFSANPSLAASTPQELMLAKLIYWVLIPLFQYILAMVLADTFQYFTHRAFHVNKWLYSKLNQPSSL